MEELKKEYVGVFYDRFIRGLWVVAEGLVYSVFDKVKHVVPTIHRVYDRYMVSIDYGTCNPTSMGLWGRSLGVWYRVKESYYDGRKMKYQRTDEEHYEELERLVQKEEGKGYLPISKVIVDPSAASFIACIRKHGRFQVEKANNAVIDGIREVATVLKQEKIKINDIAILIVVRQFFKEIFIIFTLENLMNRVKHIKHRFNCGIIKPRRTEPIVILDLLTYAFYISYFLVISDNNSFISKTFAKIS